MSRQLAFRFRTWGGARPGAGRPRVAGAGLPHTPRPALAARFPVHVTVRMAGHVYNLRSRRCFAVIAAAVERARDRAGMRLVQFSAQGNHVHLIAEASNARALARGVQGLSVRMARGLNRVMGRNGRVFADRYHARILKTPREVRFALRYVLLNFLKHARRSSRPWRNLPLDPFSSAGRFDGWSRPTSWRPVVPVTVAPPGTWLLDNGWRRHGLLDPDERPPPG